MYKTIIRKSTIKILYSSIYKLFRSKTTSGSDYRYHLKSYYHTVVFVCRSIPEMVEPLYANKDNKLYVAGFEEVETLTR